MGIYIVHNHLGSLYLVKGYRNSFGLIDEIEETCNSCGDQDRVLQYCKTMEETFDFLISQTPYYQSQYIKELIKQLGDNEEKWFKPNNQDRLLEIHPDNKANNFVLRTKDQLINRTEEKNIRSVMDNIWKFYCKRWYTIDEIFAFVKLRYGILTFAKDRYNRLKQGVHTIDSIDSISMLLIRDGYMQLGYIQHFNK